MHLSGLMECNLRNLITSERRANGKLDDEVMRGNSTSCWWEQCLLFKDLQSTNLRGYTGCRKSLGDLHELVCENGLRRGMSFQLAERFAYNVISKLGR